MAALSTLAPVHCFSYSECSPHRPLRFLFPPTPRVAFFSSVHRDGKAGRHPRRPPSQSPRLLPPLPPSNDSSIRLVIASAQSFLPLLRMHRSAFHASSACCPQTSACAPNPPHLSSATRTKKPKSKDASNSPTTTPPAPLPQTPPRYQHAR